MARLIENKAKILEPKIYKQPDPTEFEDSFEHGPGVNLPDRVRLEIYGEPKGAKATEINYKTKSVYRPTAHKVRVQDVVEVCKKYLRDNELPKPIWGRGIPVGLDVQFIFSYNKSDFHWTKSRHGQLKDDVSKWVIGKKDTDNLLKPLKDGLKGWIMADDNQVCHYGDIDKIKGVSEMTVVEVYPLEG